MVSMQLDCKNYLPTGIQRKKPTILSGCFLHKKKKKDDDDTLSISELPLFKAMTTTTAMKIPSGIHFLHCKTWPGIAHAAGYLYISD